ncbi:MAG: hypothetical protein U0325_26490 [Polyangiales bacterium]
MSAAEPLFLIPVRGGSKSVPRKNLRTVAGTSLLGRAVHRALRARQLLGGAGRVVVDTDDPELAREALRYGAEVPYLRPAALATDSARTLDVVRHCLDALEVRDGRPVVLLQATSPLTPADHVADVVHDAFATGDGAPVVSVAASLPSPAWTFAVAANDVLRPWSDAPAGHQRQLHEPSVRISGAVYVASACARCATARGSSSLAAPAPSRWTDASPSTSTSSPTSTWPKPSWRDDAPPSRSARRRSATVTLPHHRRGRGEPRR